MKRKYSNIALNNQYLFDTWEKITCPLCLGLCVKVKNSNSIFCKKCDKFSLNRYSNNDFGAPEFSTILELNGRFIWGTNHINKNSVEIYTKKEILFDLDMSNWDKFIEAVFNLEFYS